ncbi:MAG: MBL fold metallo-hydrolase [Acidimicrobiia bacterium]|nr:MBL fold metallo-hydrolase [Acidimicrobiia bacterium]
MELTVLGSSGTYPTAGNPSSGYLVQCDGTSLLLDAGSGVYVALCDFIDPGELDAVVLSHRHVDHCADIFALSHRLLYGPPRSTRVPLFVPPELADRLVAFGGESFTEAFELVEIQTADMESHAIGALRLSFAPAAHNVPALLTKVESDEASLVYTGDTGETPQLQALAHECDLLLAEASLIEADWHHHMTPDQAATAAATAGARKLALTHIRPTVDPSRALAAARAIHPNTVLATPGLTIRLPAEEH